MNKIDLILLIPILVGFIFGLFKGLVKELAALIAIFLGIYGAKLFAPGVSVLLQNKIHFSSQIASALAFVVVFVIIAVVLLVLAKWVDKFFDSLSLGALNKLGGGVFGALKLALVVSVLLNVFDAVDTKFTLIHSETKMSSLLYEPVKNFGPKLWSEAKTYKNSSEESGDEN